MKVVIFANSSWYLHNFRGGFIRYLSKKGIDVYTIAPDDEYQNNLEGYGATFFKINMNRRSLNPFRELMAIKRIMDVFEKIKPDLIHNFTIKCIVHGTIAGFMTGSPAKVQAIAGLGHVFTDKSKSIYSKVLKFFVVFLLRSVCNNKNSRLVVQNNNDKNIVLINKISSAGNVKLIRGSGVDINKFYPQDNIYDQEPIMLMAARMLWSKGVKEFIDSAELTKKQYPNYRFLLAGTPDDGNPDSIGLDLLKEWCHKSDIEYLGNVSKMSELMRKCSIFVLPTQYGEGVPKSLLEASSSGVPIICSNNPGCLEIVQHNKNGLILDDISPQNISTAIINLINNDALRKTMSKNGRDIAIHEFSEDKVNRETFSLYNELINISRV